MVKSLDWANRPSAGTEENLLGHPFVVVWDHGGDLSLLQHDLGDPDLCATGKREAPFVSWWNAIKREEACRDLVCALRAFLLGKRRVIGFAPWHASCIVNFVIPRKEGSSQRVRVR